MAKLYPFSVAKHAHSIEYYHNHLYNVMRDMEDGEIAWDEKRYDRIEEMFYGPLAELYDMMFQSSDGKIVYLTGKQLELAKRIVFWASESRARTCIEHGKLQNLQYC